jgi:hypothetical protein
MAILNMQRRRWGFAAISALVAGWVLNGCEEMAGSTSTGNTGKGSISGRVVDAEGQGVGNAKVKVFSVNYNPGPNGAASGDVADIVMTGSDGTFQTDSLADGRYNLFGEKGGLLALQDSIAVVGSSETETGAMELKKPGTVAGVIRLLPGHDSRTLFLLLPGTPVFAVPQDSSGHFKIGPLAEGQYQFRLLSTLDHYAPKDTVLTVVSGVDAVLADTLTLRYTGSGNLELPPVAGTRLAIDTSRIVFTLTWPKSSDARVVAYQVYRRKVGQGYELATTNPITDTVFSEGWLLDVHNGKVILPGDSVQYAVTTLDSLGNESRKPTPISFVVPSRLKMDSVLENANASMDLFEVAPDGSVWGTESETRRIIRLDTTGQITGWRDTSTQLQTSYFKIDEAGNIYGVFPFGNPQTGYSLAKYSAIGILQWKITIPLQGSPSDGFSISRDETSILVTLDNRIWAHFDTMGQITKLDTLDVPMNIGLENYIDPVRHKAGVGYYRTLQHQAMGECTFEMLDDKGQIQSTWRLPFQDFRDVARDGNGRWYFSADVIYLFSPEKVFLGLYPFVFDLRLVISRNNRTYMLKPYGSVHRIRILN